MDARASYFDGRIEHKRITLDFGPALEIYEDGVLLTAWGFADVRALSAPADAMALRSVASPPQARLEIRDPFLQGEVLQRCSLLGGDSGSTMTPLRSVALWAFSVIACIGAGIWFGVPYAADRIAPFIPYAWEKKLGDVAEGQAREMFHGKACKSTQGAAALAKLSQRLQDGGHLRIGASIEALKSPVPNAFALPGGKVFVLSGMISKAENQDELAGVLAHELGHLQHRDALRRMIADGGASYLIGAIFGEVAGGGALIFASKTLLNAAHSREAEAEADRFAASTLNALGRPATPMGALLLRVTGPEKDGFFTILHDHPLSEDRLAKLAAQDRPTANSAPLLSDQDWKALKAICD